MKMRIILFALFTLTIFSCIDDEQDPEPTVEDQIEWTKHSFYQHDLKAMRGIFEMGNYIVTLHDFGYGVRTYDSTNHRFDNIFQFLNLTQNPGRKHKYGNLSFPVSEKYLPVRFVEMPNSIIVYSMLKPMDLSAPWEGLEIKGEDIDPDFREFSSLGISRGNAFELKENFLFVSYNTINADREEYFRPEKFAVIEIKQSSEGWAGLGVDLVSIHTFKAPIQQEYEENFGNAFLSVLPVNDGFLVSTFFGFFKTYFDGSIKMINRDIRDNNGNLRISDSYLVKDPKSNIILLLDHTTILKSYYSTDEGESWSVLSEFSSNVDFGSLDLLRFEEFNGALFGFFNSQIFQISISPSQLMVNELDNSGLESHKITGISSYYKDSLVMVSTRSGAFYKPAEDLLKPKISDSMGLFSSGF
ncbi:hypothetical protein MM236_04270 [Belliella sp. DSM 107340]|uniref:Exo-alpha-sialidase n=1 Tax=Belliella calami TaxID=2923436 RepID=A0ABS9UKN7_9BACT|nr:hypothetical protein [Belliella calami]MCH7397188.1 hypothetical protein [Belliella calami]